MTRRTVLAGVGALVLAVGLGVGAVVATRGDDAPASARYEQTAPLLLVAASTADHIAWVDPTAGEVARLVVGTAPHGLVLGPDGLAYVATAEGVAIVDPVARELVERVPYRIPVAAPSFGEFREGGMGIDVTPDGARVAVGVYTGAGSRLEVLDTATREIVASVPVGDRPFGVVALDDTTAASIDHDGRTVTVVDLAAGSALRTLPAAPLGDGAYDKPHHAALLPDGRLALPYNGQRLLLLDPRSGESSEQPLVAATHQHGVALSGDGGTLAIVGTGPAGGVAQPPSLELVDLAAGTSRVIGLERPHEQIALSADDRTAYLTGGYLLSGGWDGITIVDLATGAARELFVESQPLGIAVLEPPEPR